MNKSNDTAVLKTALEQYNRLLCAALPGKEELEGLVFSPRFETRMAKLIRRQKRFYYPFVNTAAKRAACILAVILLTLSGLFSVKSIRDSFAAFLTEVYQKFTVLIFNTPEEEPAPSDFTVIEPRYIPEGFEVVSEININPYYEKKDRSADGKILFYSQEPGNVLQTNLDTENTYTEKILLYHKSVEGIYYMNKENRVIVFVYNNYVFTIWSTIERAELIRIAESVFS